MTVVLSHLLGVQSSLVVFLILVFLRGTGLGNWIVWVCYLSLVRVITYVTLALWHSMENCCKLYIDHLCDFVHETNCGCLNAGYTLITWRNLEPASSPVFLTLEKSCRFLKCVQTLWSNDTQCKLMPRIQTRIHWNGGHWK